MNFKKVVVTGLGAFTPVGNDVEEFWQNISNGVSAAAPITNFDASQFKTQFACEVKNYDPSAYFDRKLSRQLDKCAQFGIITADQAIEDSGLDIEKINKDRVGVIWGSGIGGIKTFEDEVTSFAEGNGIPRYSPFFIPKMIADITPGHISIRYGFRGPNFTTVSACASSANALIDALNYIRLGKADVIVVGGSEAAITEAGIGGFNALKALSTRNDDPKSASRPFDKDRDGFVMGEGGACFVIEAEEHAKARGAKIYAELAGGGMSADAYHITAPHPEGLGAIAVMKNCLEDANIKPEEVDTINMHGTSTPLGDVAESKAIIEVFGDHAYNVNINSTKSMTGHLLGAAGAVEALASVLAIVHNEVPPTVNFHTLDENIDPKLNFTFNKGQKRKVDVALSNTFGFGGHNACVIFKRYS
ncbi:MAG: beta-ketoacyl-ACP synthase II [Flavobacteriales bacterium]